MQGARPGPMCWAVSWILLLGVAAAQSSVVDPAALAKSIRERAARFDDPDHIRVRDSGELYDALLDPDISFIILMSEWGSCTRCMSAVSAFCCCHCTALPLPDKSPCDFLSADDIRLGDASWPANVSTIEIESNRTVQIYSEGAPRECPPRALAAGE